jgi:hypothetical protein
MSKREPLFHLDNLMILVNTFLGLSRLWLFPLIAITVAIFLYSIIPSYRVAGALIGMLAVIYGYCEEFVFVSPKDMVEEIRNDPTMQHVRQQPDSKTAIELSDKLLHFVESAHRFVLRTVQALMGLTGILIGLMGDDSQYVIDRFRNLIPFR